MTLSQDIFLKPATAQVTPDGTTNTTVDVRGNDFTINQGDRAGGNLFHSFRDFSVATDGSAFFNNAADIANIFSRVTGGNISNIDGLLRANGSANLFLLNPAGILFGPNARLDIGGSFFGSTADSFLFEDGEFSATDLDNPPLLTINAPIGLNFRDNPEDIVNNSVPDDSGSLSVSPGAIFALLGGDINFTSGVINSSGSNVFIGGLSESGTISLDENFNPSFPEGIARTDVTFTNGSNVTVTGGGGGSITVNARKIELSGGESSGSFLFSGIAADSDSRDAQAGDNITLNATDTISVNQGSAITAQIEPTGIGKTSGINITTTNLSLTEESFISVSTLGEGDAGNLTITASELIEATGEGSGIFSQVGPEATGNGGTVAIKTANLRISDGADISASTLGEGDAGNLTITASELIEATGGDSFIFVEVFPGATGNSGTVVINAANLRISDGVKISASTLGEGDAGNLTITASELIEATGEGSGIFSQVGPEATGNGGTVAIKTANLRISDGADISASTLGEGNAGNLTINTSELGINDGAGILANSLQSAVGNAGSIIVTTKNFNISNRGNLAVDSEGFGDGGDVVINAEFLELNNNASISATTKSGFGGNTRIQVEDNLILRKNSIITAGAFEDADGGNVDIDAQFIIAFPSQPPGDGNDIVASAEFGMGGNINITAESLINIEERPAEPGNGTNDIDASSDFGLDGNPSISPPDTNTQILSNLIESDQLVGQSCQSTRTIDQASGLIVKGKGGVPPVPTEPFMADLLIPDGKPITLDKKSDLTSLLEGEIETEPENPNYIPEDIKPIKTSRGDIYPARGIIKTEDGRIILTTYPTDNINTRTPHKSANCTPS